MKKFFDNPDHVVGFLGATNLAWAGIGSGLEKMIATVAPFLHFLLLAGQVAVAFVTVYYIWKQARAIRLKGSAKRKRKR